MREAAFLNSLDGPFAGVGYGYKRVTSNRRRPVYKVLGTVMIEGELTATHRITRALQTVRNSHPRPFHGVHLFGNAMSIARGLNVVILDLSNLLSLTELPDSFMSNCNKVTTLRLPPNINSIGELFCQGCTSLAEIDMLSLTSVKKIPTGFMYGCSSLHCRTAADPLYE